MKPGIELAGKQVLVVGLARTGIATALFCAARGARVTATEERTEPEIAETVAKLRAAGVTLELGGHGAQTFVDQDLNDRVRAVSPRTCSFTRGRAQSHVRSTFVVIAARRSIHFGTLPPLGPWHEACLKRPAMTRSSLLFWLPEVCDRFCAGVLAIRRIA